MAQQPVLTRESVLETLESVQDPELRLSILALNLVDEVDVSDGQVTVRFHLTSPFCPEVFASSIADDIKRRVSQLPGISAVHVELLRHYSAEEINQRVNRVTWEFATGSSPAPSDAKGTKAGDPDRSEPLDAEGLLRYASVRRMERRIDRATRSEYRVRWALQGLLRFCTALANPDLDRYIISCKAGQADPDATLLDFCDTLHQKGYATAAIAGICSGPKLWLGANGVNVGHRTLPGCSGVAWAAARDQDVVPPTFSRMPLRVRFILLALISSDLNLSELTALQRADFGLWDGNRDILPDVTADPLAVRVRPEVAADGHKRISFLSYDAQQALLAYLADTRDAQNTMPSDSPCGLLSEAEGRLVRRLLSNLGRISNEANVFLCMATAKELGKLS